MLLGRSGAWCCCAHHEALRWLGACIAAPGLLALIMLLWPGSAAARSICTCHLAGAKRGLCLCAVRLFCQAV